MRVRFSPHLGLIMGLMMALVLSACFGSRSRLKVGKSVEGEVVEAEGLAPYDKSDLIATKRASLVDAQRNAIEKAVGVYLSAKTMVEKAVAIENNILAKTDGYVKKYEILEEGQQDGLYRTRIRALVALKELESDLRGLSLDNVPDLQKPRVIVNIREELDKQPVDDAPAATTFQNILTKSGFIVLSKDKSKEADLLIRGSATAYPFQGQGLGGFVSYRARISLEAVRAGTEDVITSFTNEASGLGGNGELAAMKALETVGELAGQELSTTIPSIWNNSSRLIVFVENVNSFSIADRMKKHLQAQPGVDDLVMRRFDEGMAQFELIIKNIDAQSLASSLQASQSVPLNILGVQGQSLRVQLP